MDTESQQIPSLVPGVDLYALPLDTTEGFVLSCVDGQLSVQDISFMSGISVGQLVRILERLVGLGAVRWSEPTQQPPGGPEKYESEARETHKARESDRRSPAPPMSGAAESGPKTPSPLPNRLSFVQSPRPRAGRFSRPVSRRASSGGELVREEEVDLDQERKKKIYEAYSRMEEQNYYELLGVSQNASRQAIRASYFELSRTFHPDSVYGKRLGHYKPKMEAVFKRLTEAYDVLSRGQKRKEYDEYLAAAVRTRRLTAALQTGLSPAGEQPSPKSAGASQPAGADSSRPPAGAAPVEKREAIMPPATEKRPDSLPAGSLKPPRVPTERRIRMQNVLRKRLDAAVGRSLPPRGSPLPTVPPPEEYPPPGFFATASTEEEKEERRSSAIRGLFRSLKEASEATGGAVNKLEQYMRQARESEQAGDLLAAANSLRLALSAYPDNEEVRAYHERISSALARSLNQEYENRATYEEKAGKWEAAAASWAKVCEGRPGDAAPARRAAEALLKAGGDPRRAKKPAQKAVELEPENADNLLLLARVFVAADMKLNAKRELEKAAKLDPSNEMVKNLLKEVR
jgi:curved DNA-binding protein CbpA